MTSRFQSIEIGQFWHHAKPAERRVIQGVLLRAGALWRCEETAVHGAGISASQPAQVLCGRINDMADHYCAGCGRERAGMRAPGSLARKPPRSPRKAKGEARS